MYRYDEFDERLVRERAAQFREPGRAPARRLADRGRVQAAAADERPLSAAPRLHAARSPFPTARSIARQMRQLAVIADKYDRGYGHFTTRQNIQFNWPRLRDVPDILDAARRRRDALHPDLGQLHPQRHRRPFRRRRRRRDRGSAPDRRADPAMVDPPPGILLPAAQVQDRGDRRRARPRRGRGARYRHAHRPQRGRRDRLRGPGRRRPRPHADDRQGRARLPAAATSCSPISRRSCASTISRAGATTSTRRGSRSWSTRSAPRPSSPASRPNMRRLDGPMRQRRSAGDGADRRLFRAAAPTRRCRRASAALRGGAAARSRTSPASPRPISSPHKVPGYTAVTVSLKPIGGPPGDATSDQMRVARRPRRALLARRAAHHPRPERRPAACPARRRSGALGERWSRPGWQTANAGLITDIIACPGMDYCALATARSIPIAQAISERFADAERQQLIGQLGIKISGCINACGHHHVGAHRHSRAR